MTCGRLNFHRLRLIRLTVVCLHCTTAALAAAPHTALAQLGVRIALDLASWEVLQSHWDLIRDTLQTGGVDLCFCNQVRLWL